MDVLLNSGAWLVQALLVALNLAQRVVVATWDDPVRALGIAVCATVLLACICRIDLLRRGVSRSTWFCVYLLFAVYALGVLLDLVQARRVDWYECAGLGGVLLYMINTRKLWRHGPDPETVRDELRRADGSAVEEAP